VVVQRPKARVRRESDPHPLDAAARGARIRTARYWAPRVIPGPIGEFLARELDSFEHLAPVVGGDDALMWRVVDDIMTKAKGSSDGTEDEPE
jgi:hypothetical protein